MKVEKKLWQNKWLWIAIVAVVVIIGGALMFNANKKTDVTEGIEMRFEGYDGKGTSTYDSVKLNENIYRALAKKAGLSDDDIKLIEATHDSSSLTTAQYNKFKTVDTNMRLIKVSTSKSSGLSNGDKVILSITPELSSSSIKEVKKTFTVSGLKKVKTITAKDISKNLKVSFVGYNGMGQVKLKGKGFSDEVFTIKKNGHLKNGDSISLNVSNLISEGEKFAGDKKMKVKVSGLTDINKLSNVKEVTDLLSAYEQNELKSDDYETYTPELLHTYASTGERNDYNAFRSSNSGYDSSEISEEVSVNNTVKLPEISMYQLYKVTRTTPSESKVSYYVFGLNSLSVDSNKFELETVNTDDDGFHDSSTDSLTIIQKNLQSNSVLIN